MQYIGKLILKIIPPDTKEARDGFANDEIISKLNPKDFKHVEEKLINMLKVNNDLLIAQTLVKMNSKDSLPILLERLELQDSPFGRITWARLINDLKNGDDEMEKIAYKEFEKLEFIYAGQGGIFLDLIEFNSQRINKKIEEFVDHKYDMVAHHAKMVLNHKGYADTINTKFIRKNWWEFWK